MKVPASAVPASAAVPGARPASKAADLVVLTKLRLNLLVLATTLAGLYLASPDGVPAAILVHTLVGTALVAGGAAALNMAWEHEIDRRMRRTRERPLPAGRMSVAEGAAVGCALSAAGLAELLFGVNAIAAGVAAVTLAS
jgi:protoheme IX farnesyltransferase